MTDRDISLRDAWAALAIGHPVSGKVHRVASAHATPHYAAVDEQGRRVLLVPSEGKAGHLPGPFPVLHLEYRGWHLDGASRLVLSLRCEDKLFWDQFELLCRDILAGEAGADPAAHALSVIHRWRRMLSVVQTDRLSLQQRMGLMAELGLLREIAKESPTTALATWEGPRRMPHDFRREDRAIEVKAVGDGAECIHVHGLTQMEAPVNGTLDLLVAAVVEDPGGQSLHDVVQDLVDLGMDEDDLKDVLLQVAWSERDQRHTMTITKWMTVRVEGSVPRLTSSQLAAGELPSGVSTLVYTIDLESLSEHQDARSVTEVAREFTS